MDVIDETAALPPIDRGFVPADYLEDMINSLRDARREWLLPVSSGLPRVASMRFEIAFGREPRFS